MDDVAIVIVGEQFERRDIVLHLRNDRLTRVSETHRSYDALQYPILFWQGEDGYDLDIRMINPSDGKNIIFHEQYNSSNNLILYFRSNDNEKSQLYELLFIQVDGAPQSGQPYLAMRISDASICC